MCVLAEQHEGSKRLRDGCCFVVQIFVAHTLCELSEQHKCSKLFRDKCCFEAYNFSCLHTMCIFGITRMLYVCGDGCCSVVHVFPFFFTRNFFLPAKNFFLQQGEIFLVKG